MSQYLFHLAQLSPIIIPTSTLLSSIFSQSLIGVVFTFLCVISHFISSGLKYASLQWLSTGYTRRPGASDATCHVFPSCTKDNIPGVHGMPSYHAQLAILTLVFWSIYSYSISTTWYIPLLIISALVVMAVFIMYSRYRLGCHTGLQLAVGGVVGAILGGIGYIIVHAIGAFKLSDQGYTGWVNVVATVSAICLAIAVGTAMTYAGGNNEVGFSRGTRTRNTSIEMKEM